MRGVSRTAQWIDRFTQTSSPRPGAAWAAHVLALTTSPMRAERLGATWLILERRYSCRPLRYSDSEMTRLEKLSMLMRSRGEMSIPGETGIVGLSGTSQGGQDPSYCTCTSPPSRAPTICPHSPMEEREASRMACALALSMTISSSPSKLSSLSSLRFPMNLASRQ